MVPMHDSDRAWKKFGETEAYYAVCSRPEFRGKTLTDESRIQFFRSGEEHVRTLLQIVRQQLIPEFRPLTALDFGCGVGRLVIPLAGHCEQVVGVDVAPAMLEEANRNCKERGLKNVAFLESLDQLKQLNSRFDLVHSYIVLQHIPSDRGMTVLSDLIDCVADEGAGVLHVTYSWEVPRWRKTLKTLNWFRRRVPFANNCFNIIRGFPVGRPLMQMNAYDLNQICRLLAQKNCHNVVLRFTNHRNHLGVVFLFRKQGQTSF